MEAEQSNHDDDDGVPLPEDIVFDVLARLPAKVLCRFRCVSKAWRALISDPTFVAAHTSHAGGAHLVRVFLTCTWPPEVRVMDMDGNVVRRLEVRPLGKQDDGDDVSGVLQQQATTTPLNVIVYRNQPIGATAMIVDPAAGRACTVDTYTSGHMLNFGRATPSGSLKILRVELSRQQICSVATIVDDGGAEPLRWRRRSAPPFVHSWYPQSRATVNGVVYFVPHVCGAASSSAGSHRIAAFDLESEEWKVISGPALGILERAPTLTEHKQTLGFVQSLREHDDAEYDYAIIWLLSTDYNESVWVKDCVIQVPKTWELTKPLGTLDDGRILLLVTEWVTDFIDHFERQFLVFYNTSTKTFTEFKDKETLGLNDIVVLYTGSLLS